MPNLFTKTVGVLLLSFNLLITYAQTKTESPIEKETREIREYVKQKKEITPWQHPIIKAVESNSPDILIVSNPIQKTYYDFAAIDTKNHSTYLVNRMGFAQEIPLDEFEYKLVVEDKQINLFDLLVFLAKVDIKELDHTIIPLRIDGGTAKTAKIAQATFRKYNIDISPKSSLLQKLIALENKRAKKINSLYDMTMPLKPLPQPTKWEFMKWRGRYDTKRIDDELVTTFYNRDDQLAVQQALVYHTSGKVYMRDFYENILDSMWIQPDKINALVDEKINIFLLYRGWLEREWQQSNAWIDSLSTLRNNKEIIQYASYNLLVDMQKNAISQSREIDKKIERLTYPDTSLVQGSLALIPSDREWNPATQQWDRAYTQTRGDKRYELTDHRGNVVAVVSDKKTGIDKNNDGIIDYYEPDIITAQDYYSFGMIVHGRSFMKDEYRYGYNGKGNDNEVKGEGNQQDYGFRIYDPRLGRFLSVDPLTAKYPMLTPYQFASNRPIDGVDQDGLEFANFWSRMKGLVLGKTALKYNNLSDGFGDVQQQNYRLNLSNTTRSVQSLYSKISTDINSIYGTDQGSFKFSDQQNKDQISKNDLIQINPGLKAADIFVKVTDVQQYDESNKRQGVDPPHKGFSATFRTMQGHVEVGVITFTALEIMNPQTGVVSFEFDIFSTSRINHGVGTVLNSAISLPRNAQQSVWQQVLQNVSNFMGGKVEDANQLIYKFKYSDYKDQNDQGTTLGEPETTATPEITTKKIEIKAKK